MGNPRTQTAASLHRFFSCLQARLAGPLPGRSAQMLMAPLPRPGWDRSSTPARQSGVLILFYPHQGQFHLPLILRPTYDGTHSGQVAFPGGGREDGDADVTATALREAQEEIGIRPADVQVLGRLTPVYIRPSNYQVHPTVGRLPTRPRFRPDPQEVARLLEVPLDALLDPAHRHREQWNLQDRQALVPFFAIQEQRIWGATAMILSELLAVVESCNYTPRVFDTEEESGTVVMTGEKQIPCGMAPLDQDVDRILISAGAIQARVRELGQRIDACYRGKDLLLIAVLKGSVLFLADLMRAISIPHEVDFLATSSYGASSESSGVVRILKDLDEPIVGRHVLLVEDIIDSGHTLAYLTRLFSARSPASLEIVTLLDKPGRREVAIDVRWTGFSVPNEFVIGYGLDFDQKYRNLPYIGVLKPEVYTQ